MSMSKQEIEQAVDSTFDVIDCMSRIRSNINMVKSGKITPERALERIEEALDEYEQGELLWVADELQISPTNPGGLRS